MGVNPPPPRGGNSFAVWLFEEEAGCHTTKRAPEPWDNFLTSVDK
jgi:hypothetical protein